MKRPLRQPCAEWADALAAVSLADLSPEAQAALKVHLVTCAACAAVRADYWRMDAHIRAWPAARPLDSLPPALVQLWAEEGRRSVHDRAVSSWPRENGMRTHEENPVSLPTSGAQPRRRPLRGLVSGISAVAAVVVIAIIVTALVFSHGGQPAKTGSASNVPTNKDWQAVPHLTNTPDDPVIAPSNPQVVYEGKMASADLPASVTLQRSDDGGATWHILALPDGITQVYSATFMVNPVSDQRVFVDFATPCSSAQANTFAPAFAPYSGGVNSCIFAYFSTDGGAHWSLVHFPVHQAGLKAGFDYPGTGYGLQAQGDHLYDLISTPVNDYGSSFLSSTDGGATWQFIDQPMVAQGDCVAGYAATPAGSTVFAATVDQCFSASGGAAAASSLAVPFSGCCGGGGGPIFNLWRSNDAGAHWTLVGPAPDSRLHLSLNSAGQPVLFLAPTVPELGRGEGGVPPKFSTDGGQTWQDGPLPNGQSNSSDILGTLSDGSIVVSFTDNKTLKNHLLSWKPGDAVWHPLNGTFQGTPQYLLVILSGNGQQTLWLITQANSNQTGNYTVQRLTV